MTLRPRDSGVALDDIVLVINEDPGTIITGTWKATALNAEGVSEGSFKLGVSKTPVPVGELLALNASDDE